MIRKVLQCIFLLVCVDFLMRFSPFKTLHSLTLRSRIRAHCSNDGVESQLCRAMDIACVFYFKRVLCLQRSVATTLLLRRYGLPAELVIGVQILPFKSHAWVELHGTVINDRPYVTTQYQQMSRC